MKHLEKLEILRLSAQKALGTLEDILKKPFDLVVRDATIQRFEYCFEITWKLLKEYLKSKEGIVCTSPKSCFREAFSIKILSKEETELSLQMTDDRNLTSHTYHEGVAEALYQKMQIYYDLMDKIVCGIE